VPRLPPDTLLDPRCLFFFFFAPGTLVSFAHQCLGPFPPADAPCFLPVVHSPQPLISSDPRLSQTTFKLGPFLQRPLYTRADFPFPSFFLFLLIRFHAGHLLVVRIAAHFFLALDFFFGLFSFNLRFLLFVVLVPFPFLRLCSAKLKKLGVRNVFFVFLPLARFLFF